MPSVAPSVTNVSVAQSQGMPCTPRHAMPGSAVHNHDGTLLSISVCAPAQHVRVWCHHVGIQGALAGERYENISHAWLDAFVRRITPGPGACACAHLAALAVPRDGLPQLRHAQQAGVLVVEVVHGRLHHLLHAAGAFGIGEALRRRPAKGGGRDGTCQTIHPWMQVRVLVSPVHARGTNAAERAAAGGQHQRMHRAAAAERRGATLAAHVLSHTCPDPMPAMPWNPGSALSRTHG